MKKIFIDLEFTRVDRTYREVRKVCGSEIIEIGAVAIDEDNHVTDRFDVLINPRYSRVSREVTKLTHITEDMLKQGVSFEEAMRQYLDWIGDEEVIVYSWSTTDLYQMKKECFQKGYNDERLDSMYETWVDFQKDFGILIDSTHAVSLDWALTSVVMDFDGAEHRAVDDAENTAKLYLLTLDEEAFAKQRKKLQELMGDGEELRVSLGSMCAALQNFS